MGCFSSKQKEQASEMIGKGVSLRISQNLQKSLRFAPHSILFFSTMLLL